MDNKTLFTLADSCMAGDRTRTPEKLWLRERFERLAESRGLARKEDLDRLVYTRVFNREPETSSDLLKVRYWRSGRTSPASRPVLLALGNALELNEEEMNYLILRYYDRNDCVFPAGESTDPVCLERRAFMAELKREFTDKLHPMHLMALHIRREDTERFFRHLYYLESLLYTNPELQNAGEEFPSLPSRLTSVSYGSTLLGMMRLEGEIPRRNMLRHLLILMAPFISRARMDCALEKLGFLPLTPEHHMPGGEKLDLLLIRIFEAYDAECRGMSPETCVLWLRRVLCDLDHYLEQSGAESLRFMQYKSIARGKRS